MTKSSLRTGIIGAGYIATWHADAINAISGVNLVAVCDMSESSASSLADNYGATAYADLDQMIEQENLDAVHILTPPNTHHHLALRCANAGLHCFVEKPVSVSASETTAMVKAGQAADRLMAAGHNFLAMPSYLKLRKEAQQGGLGRISSAEFNWCLPLAPLRSGPFGLWLLREPQNLLLEIGPHPFAFAADLFGPVEIKHLRTSKPIALPGGARRFQSFQILAQAGEVDLTFNISLVESIDDRSVTVKGSSGLARLNYAADTLMIQQENAADLVINPLRKQLSLGWQEWRQGAINFGRQLTSLNRKSPYGLSFEGAVGSFYDSIHQGKPLDKRFDMSSAQLVMDGIEAAVGLLPKTPGPARPKGTPSPTVMVIGGTGFIGRALTRGLVEKGHDVRVLSRGRTGPFDDIAQNVETVPVSLHDKEGLTRVMQGIHTVYNFAKSMDKTWDAALVNDVAVSTRIAEAAVAAKVRRFIYTGTIASYDMSDPHNRITEETAFGHDMRDRNIYARSKAECEKQLQKMHLEKGLPLVIARPGIVVGEGGPLQHWGIGRWHGAGAVRIWGHGRNKLPFVLIDDLTDALTRLMQTERIEGQSFNLVGDPLLSARDYFTAIHQEMGAKIDVASSNLTVLFITDACKHALKTQVLRRKGLTRASLKDWKSRAHFSPFDNSKSKEVLGWEPTSDREKLVSAAITEANLFGF